MGRKTVALNLDESIYQAYRKYCEENSMVVSRKIEKLMAEELKKNKQTNPRNTGAKGGEQ